MLWLFHSCSLSFNISYWTCRVYAAETSGPMFFWKFQVKQRFLSNLQLSYVFQLSSLLTLLQWMQIHSTVQKCAVKKGLQMFFLKHSSTIFFSRDLVMTSNRHIFREWWDLAKELALLSWLCRIECQKCSVNLEVCHFRDREHLVHGL